MTVQKRDAIARNTTFVLVILLLGAFFALGIQRAQIREMREIDCAAYKERVSRVMLYDDLMGVWSRTEALPRDEADKIVQSYGRQRLAVIEAVEAGDPSDCK